MSEALLSHSILYLYKTKVNLPALEIRPSHHPNKKKRIDHVFDYNNEYNGKILKNRQRKSEEFLRFSLNAKRCGTIHIGG